MNEERKGTRGASKRAEGAQRVPAANSRDSSNGLHREQHTSREETPHAPSARRVGHLDVEQSGELEQRRRAREDELTRPGSSERVRTEAKERQGGARRHASWLRQGSRTTRCRRLVPVVLAVGTVRRPESSVGKGLNERPGAHERGCGERTAPSSKEEGSMGSPTPMREMAAARAVAPVSTPVFSVSVGAASVPVALSQHRKNEVVAAKDWPPVGGRRGCRDGRKDVRTVGKRLVPKSGVGQRDATKRVATEG